MRNGFPPGSWGDGSPGDPDLDALLPQAAVESLLDGAVRGVPEELVPLTDTLAALRAAPSTVDLGAEERALAAFRALSAAGVLGDPTAGDGALPGPDGPDDPDLLAHTLELEVPPGHAVGRRRGGARHRARPAAETRSATRGRAPGGRSRPSAGKRLALAIATTAAALVIVGAFAYAGRLPGPFQRVAHAAIGAPSADRPATASSLPSSDAPSLNGSATLSPQSSTSAPSSATTTDGPAARECLRYFQNPQRPGAKSWDQGDWAKLAAAVHPPGDIGAVWQYCHAYLFSSGQPKPGIYVMPAHGHWPIPQGDNTRQGGNAQSLRLP
jgi:hypothetical protein